MSLVMNMISIDASFGKGVTSMRARQIKKLPMSKNSLARSWSNIGDVRIRRASSTSPLRTNSVARKAKTLMSNLKAPSD